jgi:hypothetical protein
LDGPEAKRTVRLQCIESLVERFSYRKKCDHACTAIAEMAQAWSIDQVKESRVHLHEWIETIGRLIHEDQGMYLMRLVPYLLRAGSVANDPFWMQVAQLILDLDYRDTHALSELKDSLCEQSKLRKIPVSLSSIFVAYFIGLDDLSGMLAAIKVSREPLTSLPLKAISPLDVTWPEAMRSWAPHQKNISMIHAALACSKGLLPGGTFSHMDCFRALCLVPDALRAAQLNPTPWALADRSLKELRLLAAEHPWLLAADKKGRNFLHVWGAHPRHPKQMAGDLKALLVHPLSGWSDAADNTGQLGFHSALSACSTVEKIKAQMPTVKRKQYGMSTKKRL